MDVIYGLDSLLQKLVPLCILTFAYYTWRTKIPLVFTQAAAQKVILSILDDEIRARSDRKVKIYDLGSGLGGLCFAIARHFPEAEVVGLEMAWPIWLVSFARQKLFFRKNARFKLGDFWKHDIRDGDIVIFYLGDVVMNAMTEKLRNEPRAGRLIISNTFPLSKEWPPERRIPIEAKISKEILVYRQP